MNGKRVIIKSAFVAMGALAALHASSLAASAQCAMCKTGIMNSPDAARLAEKFNFAIFVLLIPPVLIFSGFFVVAYKYRKAQGDEQPLEQVEKSFLRVWLNRLSFRRKRREGKGPTADDALT